MSQALGGCFMSIHRFNRPRNLKRNVPMNAHCEPKTLGPLAALLVFALVQPVNVRAQDRLPPIPPEKMTDAQKKAAADYKGVRKADPAGPPWSVIMRVPD